MYFLFSGLQAARGMTEIPHSLSSGGTHEYRFTSREPLGANERQRLQQCLSETLTAVSMEIVVLIVFEVVFLSF